MSVGTVTIDCMLSSVTPQYQADGCIYEMSGVDRRLRAPGFLSAGDLVRVRLWLPNDESYITIRLAEVRWVRNQWVAIEFLAVDACERARLVRYSEAQQQEPRYASSEQMLIRA